MSVLRWAYHWKKIISLLGVAAVAAAGGAKDTIICPRLFEDVALTFIELLPAGVTGSSVLSKRERLLSVVGLPFTGIRVLDPGAICEPCAAAMATVQALLAIVVTVPVIEVCAVTWE